MALAIFDHNSNTFLTSFASSAIRGTTTNDNAAAGFIGEYITAVSGATAFPATGVVGDATSVILTAGDWDVSANILFNKNGATITGGMLVFLGLVAGNNTTGDATGDNDVNASVGLLNAGTNLPAAIPSVRFSLAAGATVYLKFVVTYSAGAPQLFGRLSARRAR